MMSWSVVALNFAAGPNRCLSPKLACWDTKKALGLPLSVAQLLARQALNGWPQLNFSPVEFVQTIFVC